MRSFLRLNFIWCIVRIILHDYSNKIQYEYSTFTYKAHLYQHNERIHNIQGRQEKSSFLKKIHFEDRSCGARGVFRPASHKEFVWGIIIRLLFKAIPDGRIARNPVMRNTTSAFVVSRFRETATNKNATRRILKLSGVTFEQRRINNVVRTDDNFAFNWRIN